MGASFVDKWWAFFSPVAGWKLRYRQYKAGKTVWDVPGKPEANKLVPWPLEWVPHRMTQENDLEADQQRGFLFLPATCAETGQEAAVGEAVRCLRCGVDLHPKAANQLNSLTPPVCPRCTWLVRLVLL